MGSKFWNCCWLSIGIESVVDKSRVDGGDAICTACEMAVVWMQKQLKQNETQEHILNYINDVEPNVQKIEEHRRKYERLRKQREAKKVQQGKRQHHAEHKLALSASLNLRTVTIHNFLWRWRCSDSDWLFDDEDEDMKLVRLLLKQYKVLGKKVIVTSWGPKMAMKPELLHTEGKTVDFPKGV